MKSFAHYLKDYDLRTFSGTTFYGNESSSELPLIANCAGFTEAEIDHTHANDKGRLDYYLIYVLSEGIQLYKGKEWEILSLGSVVVIPPNTPYKYRCITIGASFLWVHFTGSLVNQILERYKISIFPSINKTATINNVNARFQKLFEGFARNDDYRQYDLSSLLDRLLIEIGRSIGKNERERVSLSKSIRFINENYTAQIKIPDLAKMENMCMTAYNMAFKAQMGMPPTKYIIKLRTDNASELLRTTNMTIKEIGSICGYDDVNFFRKTFKRAVGISPLEYRRKFCLSWY
ncbi:MAG: helix-turn-helix domain-containing protein [Clostridia bacterium]|nr:helix-turn-helix domain-containing protein [Clostridia bacterium]